ncbi:MAG: sulfotransferase [Gammaproteobacteria bacterium]|jgi:hypothetical protein|nr:sulfotransferase [Gammaproteobacteria bacterium]
MERPFIPDFFIVGAPRCGTTALASYLRKHPQVCFSNPKEPHYFNRVAEDVTQEQVRRDYLSRFFGHCLDRHTCVGEGSVSYLYSPAAIDLIRRFNPAAKFIVMVRNPVDLLRSYHQRLLHIFEEEVEDLADAWGLQEARARGERVPGFTRDPRTLRYRNVAMLGEHVERLIQQAGRDRVLVVVLDDMVLDAGAVYRQVLAFLGLEDDARRSFPRRHQSQGFRYRWLQRLLFNPPGNAGNLVMAYEAARATEKRGKKKSWLRRLRKRLVTWNSVPRSPAPLAPVFRAELEEVFREDVARLGALIGRDLSHWLSGRGAATTGYPAR